MNRHDWLKYTTASATALAIGGSDIILSVSDRNSASAKKIRRLMDGNYELSAEVDAPSVVVTFSEREDWPIKAVLEIVSDRFTLARYKQGTRVVLKEQKGSGGPPWKIRLLKKGSYYRYWVNGAAGWVREPLGVWETNHPTHQSEPVRGFLDIEIPEGKIISASATMLPWLPSPPEPAIRRGPDGSFKEGHVLVGGIIEHKGTFYLYFSGSRYGCQEGGGARQIGVAHSKDLKTWMVEPEPIVRIGAKGSWEPTGIYCSGAVVTPEGKIALMYAAQNFPEWGGFGLALADHPLGPFTKFSGNPVYKHYTHAHEFDLVRTHEPGRPYLMFYTGFTDKPSRGPIGDRGYILYSDDLVHWEPHPRNPVFQPETRDNWDAVHIRPRSLTRIGDTWYLWYEGVNLWDPPIPTALGEIPKGWVHDTVGLARSKDLENWQYYPRNPALPAPGISKYQFDTGWVGWPRMFVKDNVGHVFYAGGSNIGVRTIAIDRLTNWDSEGGQTLDLLKGNS